MKYIVFMLLTTLLLFGCKSVNVKQYSENQPQLDLYEYFTGSTRGWGIVQDRQGNLLRQFVVSINGYTNKKGALVLKEDFDWSDGEKTQRIWTITPQGEQIYVGQADDVIGEAAGKVYGNVLNWQYQLNIVVDGRTWKVLFDDWMFLQPNNVLINRASMSKLGFRVGEVTIVFNKTAG